MSEIYCSALPTFLLLLWLISPVFSARDVLPGIESCFLTGRRCAEDPECSIRMLTVEERCGQLLRSRSHRPPPRGLCSAVCKNALLSLSESTYGKAWSQCPCQQDSVCLAVKARSERCVNDREEPQGMTCERVKKLCSKNRECYGLYTKFIVDCNRMMSGEECSADCWRTLNIWLEHPIASSLKQCECGGTLREEANCLGIRLHAEALCINKSTENIVYFKKIDVEPMTARPLSSIIRSSATNDATAEDLSMDTIHRLLVVFAIQIFVILIK